MNARKPKSRVKLDALDRRILDRLQDDCRITAATLGEQVGLSPSAVQRRLDRLRSERIIEREVAVISPRAAGRSLFLIVEVSVEKEVEAVSRLFRQQVQRIPQILQCYYVTGSADYVMLWAVRDMEEYDEITAELFGANERVSRFITSVVMRTIKYGLKIPIDENGD